MSKIKTFITNHFNIFAFIMFTVIAFSLYGKTLSFDFSYYDDDVLILDRQDYLSFSNIKNIVSNITVCKKVIIFFIILVIIAQVVLIPLIIKYSYSY